MRSTIRIACPFAILLLTCLAVVPRVQAQQTATGDVRGYWSGAITIMGRDLVIKVDFTQKGDSLHGVIDIPQQMAKGLPLTNIRYTHPNIRFDLPAGPGLAKFDGAFAGDSIRGAFAQSGFTGTFALARAERPVEPQEDTTAPPYTREEVTFSSGDVKLAGTLTLPAGTGPHPAVVLVTGSGPQNRDEEILGFKPFKVIADHLTRAGIAVLRYDDRGVGGSGMGAPDATTEDFMQDALAAVHFLTARREITTSKIGMLGHSEGGIIAPMAAARSKDVAFVVLLAAPSWPGDTIVSFQVEVAMKEAGADAITISRNLATQHMIYDAVRTGEGWDALRARLREDFASSIDSLPADVRANIGDRNAFIEQRVGQTLAPTRSKWFKYFITHDPAEALRTLRVPVLALFGEKDMQVPAKLNMMRMKECFKAGGVRDFSIKVIPSANHLFQLAGTGSANEYASLEKRFAPGVLESLSMWILEKTK